jgi:hypothetical protein
MDDRTVAAAGRRASISTPPARASDVLWHLCRRDSPPISAVLTGTASGECELRVAFGTVAMQRSTFASPVAAAEHAERLRTRLEAWGYRRQRSDNRPGRSGGADPIADPDRRKPAEHL